LATLQFLLYSTLFAFSVSYFSSKSKQKDALNNILLSTYLHLQSEGFLSTWSNSFVGTWDPSQGEHNPSNDHMYWLLNVYLFFFHLKFRLVKCIPHEFAMLTDEKIKLWLFLPDCHSSVCETTQPAVNKLRRLILVHISFYCDVLIQCSMLYIASFYRFYLGL
jgi:hypothetical protein